MARLQPRANGSLENELVHFFPNQSGVLSYFGARYARRAVSTSSGSGFSERSARGGWKSAGIVQAVAASIKGRFEPGGS